MRTEKRSQFIGFTIVNHCHASWPMMMSVHMMRLLMNTGCESSIKIFGQTPHHSRVNTNAAHFIVVQHRIGFSLTATLSILSKLSGQTVQFRGLCIVS